MAFLLCPGLECTDFHLEDFSNDGDLSKAKRKSKLKLPRELAAIGVIVLVLIGAAWSFMAATKEDESTMEPTTIADQTALSRTTTHRDEGQTPSITVEGADTRITRPGKEVAIVESAEVLVLDSQAKPLADARIFICDADDILNASSTDKNGKVKFDATDADVIVLILAHGHATFRTALRMAPGRHTITLKGGSTLKGQLWVDKKVPGEEIVLKLYRYGKWTTQLRKGLPKGIKERLPRYRSSLYAIDALVSADGRFVIHGLPDEEPRGSFSLPPEFAFLVDSKIVTNHPLTVSKGDVKLQATRLSLLVGRIVENDTNRPVGAARVNIEFPLDGKPGNTRNHGTYTDELGEFRLGVPARQAQWAKLTITRAGTQLRQELTGPFEATTDLGDIAIESLRDLSFEIVDVSLRPIAKAIVLAAKGKIRSALSGPDGICTLKQFSKGVREIEVGALGFEPRMVAIDSSTPSPKRVTLESGNKLTIRLVDQSGELQPGWTIAVIAKKEPATFLLSRYFPAESIRAIATIQTRMGRSSRDGSTRSDFQVGKKGSLTLYGFHPDASFEVIATSMFGKAEARVGPIELGRVGQRTIDLVVKPKNRRNLHIRVLGPKGKVIKGATVSIGDPNQGTSMRQMTGENGEVVFKNVDLEFADLTIQFAGYATLLLENHRLRIDEQTEELTLERGTELLVHVVDRNKKPVTAQVSSKSAGMTIFAKRQDDGTYLLENLTGDSALIRTRIGGHSYEKSVELANGRAMIEVPVHGSLDVSWQIKLEGRRNRIMVESNDELKSTAQFRIKSTVDGEQILGYVLPGKYLCWIESHLKTNGRWTWTVITEKKAVEIRQGSKALIKF